VRLDISWQVFVRSARMGLLYVIISLVMGIFLTVGLNIGATVGNVVSGNGNAVPLGDILSLLVVPMGLSSGLS